MKLRLESGFTYPFEREAWTPIFIKFGAILALFQGWANQGLKYALLSTFSGLKYALLSTLVDKSACQIS